MSVKDPARAFDEAVAEIPTCALTEDSIREQRERYARNAPHQKRIEREPEALVVEFDERYDRETLEEALAVERECCPFFHFEFDEGERRLRITVREAEQLAALDALSHAFGPRRSEVS